MDVRQPGLGLPLVELLLDRGKIFLRGRAFADLKPRVAQRRRHVLRDDVGVPPQPAQQVLPGIAAQAAAVLAEEGGQADLVVGAVLIPGARAPRLVTEEMVRSMSPGSVIVDVAIDQGGSIETIDRITTHDNPTYVKHGVVHYAVANMPGAVARTSTIALTNVTTPYGLQIASKGYRRAALDNRALARGINAAEGKITFRAVAEAHGYAHTDVQEILEGRAISN